MTSLENALIQTNQKEGHLNTKLILTTVRRSLKLKSSKTYRENIFFQKSTLEIENTNLSKPIQLKTLGKKSIQSVQKCQLLGFVVKIDHKEIPKRLCVARYEYFWIFQNLAS